MKKLHIHRFKRVGLYLEQPVMTIEAKQVAIENQRAYWDLEIKKCRCGKEKKVLHNFYVADRAYRQINDNLISLQLINKQSLI